MTKRIDFDQIMDQLNVMDTKLDDTSESDSQWYWLCDELYMKLEDFCGDLVEKARENAWDI